MEGLGRAVWQSKCNTVSKEGGELADSADILNRQVGDDDMGYRQLTHGERYAMANMLHQGYSYRAIALVLGRAPPTISRERRRNATAHDGHYRAEKAQQYATARRRRTRKKNQFSLDEWAAVAQLLRCKWSPAQIVGRRRALRQPSMSKETIYRYVRQDRRSGGQL